MGIALEPLPVSEVHPALLLLLRLRRVAKHAEFAFAFESVLDRVASMQVR